ncbi:putative sporulation protein YtxC [Paenibacillus eucommiae]|uniref:Sporulation protein YtxC n=1 Tax=Paenibacillus eucommiae TaxID=1355755 RepID=A0ABS4J0V9_9BACL|nr:putative sporulation protein YtxC [Paenibacillus eucommiae]MBP1993473.1 putative sporulation protein YtxC [Paenibacillus eucommiae]
MELFTIVMGNSAESSVNELYQALDNKLAHVHKDPIGFELSIQQGSDYSLIQGTGSEGARAAFPMEVIGDTIADYILKHLEPDVLHDLITRKYKLHKEDDIRSVEGYCRQFLNGTQDASPLSTLIERRHNLISIRVSGYLQEHSLIVLEGFVRFRLQEYLEELREVVEYAVDESLMDRQYQEFISLLQYFVYMQEAKMPTAHLIHKGGHDFLIFNDQLEPVDLDEYDATFKVEVLEKDVNFEDMIVSTLITVSPAKIYIHTREPELPIVNTIMQIFEGRATVCPYCRMCHAYLGDLAKKDQLYP